MDLTKLLGMDENSPEAKMLMEGFAETASLKFETFLKSPEGQKVQSVIPSIMHFIKSKLGKDDKLCMLRTDEEGSLYFYFLDTNKLKIEAEPEAMLQVICLDNPIQLLREKMADGSLLGIKNEEENKALDNK